MLSSCLRRSVSALALLLFPDHVHKLLKADIRVMGAWGSFRVVLNGHGSLLSVHHTSTCAIIEVDVCHLYTFRQRLRIYSVVVVLCTDLNASCMADKALLRCAWSSQIMLNRIPQFGRNWLSQFMPCQYCSNTCICICRAIPSGIWPRYMQWCRESSNVNIAESAFGT